MKHLIVCREYPPAPGGGIGTYVYNISRLLAESGEQVHIISQLWEGAEHPIEQKCDGRLIIHRVPFEDGSSIFGPRLHPLLRATEGRTFFKSGFHPLCFSWIVGHLTERLVQEEGIDIIEAQEFEAPLFHFQMRRALGLGPKRRPPCLIHLHSPYELIARHNDSNQNSAFITIARQLEQFSIAAADALLCPSRYLARWVEAHHTLEEGSVRVIPYPLGAVSLLYREGMVWENGTVCYVGRLERRKGILEWIDAAVRLALEYPTARFEFIGRNVLGRNRMESEYLLQRLIPHELKPRFRFRGEQSRTSTPGFLAGARMAVVPSRWENFPYACMEAMGSGLPVIASREGGMVEMIEDGYSGWLARTPGMKGLAEALQRALETPPKWAARMGMNASVGISRLCDERHILEQQMDLREQVVREGVRPVSHFPLRLPLLEKPVAHNCVGAKDFMETIVSTARAVVCHPGAAVTLIQEKMKMLSSRTGRKRCQ